MEFEEPSKFNFTLYCKTGCVNCSKLKKLLKEYNFNYTVVSCDEYLLENREEFLEFIENKANTEIKYFPIVFYEGVYIGSYLETKKYVETFLSFL